MFKKSYLKEYLVPVLITLTKIHLMEIFGAGGQWKVLATSMLTAPQRPSFREAVEAKAK